MVLVVRFEYLVVVELVRVDFVVVDFVVHCELGVVPDKVVQLVRRLLPEQSRRGERFRRLRHEDNPIQR